MGKYLKLLSMARLFLAQDALLPPDFEHRASWRVKALRALFTFGAPRFKPEMRGRGLSERIRKLGPTYIKIGQFLATRPDIIGLNLAADLRHLQDRLPAFDDAAVARTLKTELETPETLLHQMGPAIAAASIAQVHKATEPPRDGASPRPLAVKILRPGIEDVLARELSALFTVAKLAERCIPFTRRLRPFASVSKLAETVTLETDLRLEAAALSEMAENTKNERGFRVPAIYWPATAKRVLAMEWIDGINAADLDALDAAGIDRSDLAARLIRLFLKHALRDGFFHADLHQGNMFIEPDGTIVAIDFGIVGRLDPDSRRFLAEILYGFIQRDYMKVAQIHFEAGYVPEGQSVDAFAQALRAVVEPIRDMRAGDIPMSRVLNQLFEVTEQFNMATQPQLLLLQKTMVTVEGVARSFDPKLDFWTAAEPVIAGWLRQQLGPEAILRDARAGLAGAVRVAQRLPDTLVRLERALDRMDTDPDPTPPRARLWVAIGLAYAGLAAMAAFIFLKI